MIAIIVAAILSLAAIGFLIWFWARTPDNLAKWYCVPVTLFGVAAIIAFWFFVVLPIL